MTKNFCDHCGKEVRKIVLCDDLLCESVPDYDGAFMVDGDTMLFHSNLILCKPCYKNYWEKRKVFDIEYFSGGKK